MSDVSETPGGSGDAGSTGGTGDTTTAPLTIEQIEQAADGHDGVTGKPEGGTTTTVTVSSGSGQGSGGSSAATTPSGTGRAADTTTGTKATPAEPDASAGSSNGRVSEEFEQLPPWAQKRIRALEKESGDNRVKAKTAQETADERVKANADKLQSFIDGFAKVMGLTEDGEPEDKRPKTIDEAMHRLSDTQGLVEQWTDRHRELQVQLAVWQTAAGLGAVTPELMDSAGFLNKIKGLDPSADGFADQLAELISAQVESNPARFKVQPPAAAPKQSGGEFTGGPGGQRSDADMSIEDHIRQIDPVSAAARR